MPIFHSVSEIIYDYTKTRRKTLHAQKSDMIKMLEKKYNLKNSTEHKTKKTFTQVKSTLPISSYNYKH